MIRTRVRGGKLPLAIPIAKLISSMINYHQMFIFLDASLMVAHQSYDTEMQNFERVLVYQ